MSVPADLAETYNEAWDLNQGGADVDRNAVGAEIVSPLVAVTETGLAANITGCAWLKAPDTAAICLGDGSVVVACLGGAGEPALDVRHRLVLHRVACVALRPLGGGFVSAGQDGRVMAIADAGNPEPAILWSPRQAAGPGGGAASDLDDWIECLVVDEERQLAGFSFGKTLIVCRPGGEVVCRADVPSHIYGLAFDPDCRQIAASHLDGISVLSLSTGARENSLAWKGPHIGVTWSPNGRFIVSATQEKELHVWDLVTGEDFRIGGYSRKIASMDWTIGGDLLVCSGADVVTAWPFVGSGPGGRLPVEIGFVFASTVSAVAAHPVKPLVAAGYHSGSVLIGACKKGEAIIARARTGEKVSALAWSNDGRMLLAGDTAGRLACFSVPETFNIR